MATVSRVVNGSQNVKPQTRERVLRAIEALAYVPNTAARQLSGGKTLTVGIVTPFFTIPSFAERLAAIQRVLWDSKYELVLHSVNSPLKLEGKLIGLMRQRRVDGVILLTPPTLSVPLWEVNPTMPLVLVDAAYTLPRYPHIAIDNRQGGRLATEHLLAQGHRRIGFIGDVLDNDFGFTTTRQRYEGYTQALSAAGIALEAGLCRFGDTSHEAARAHAYALLSLPQPPTAIFATSDAKAFDVLEVARALGRRVPQDVAVMGFDDIEAATYVQLSTVRQNLQQSGTLAAEWILALLNGESIAPLLHTLPLEVIRRATT